MSVELSLEDFLKQVKININKNEEILCSWVSCKQCPTIISDKCKEVECTTEINKFINNQLLGVIKDEKSH